MSKILIAFLLLLPTFKAFAIKETYHHQLGLYNEGRERALRTKSQKASVQGYDERYRTFYYAPKTAYELPVLYDNGTYVEFDTEETITTIQNNKQERWQMQPAKNRLYIKPLASDADTNMVLFTSKRKYFFELKAIEPIEDINKDPNYAFEYAFQYKKDTSQRAIETYHTSILPDLSDTSKYNFAYSLTGPVNQHPLKVFDDGEFTYFEFSTIGNAPLPAVFSVDSNDYESIVNYRIDGPYVVVEQVSGRFTLRNGPDTVCVFNNTLYRPLISRYN